MKMVFMQVIKIFIGLFLIAFLFGCRTESILEEDAVAPVFGNIPEDVSIELETDLDLLDLGLTASDDVDGDLTSSITVDILDTALLTVGEYVVTYSVSDSAGNITEQTINISVLET